MKDNEKYSVVLLRSQDIISDSRVLRYERLLKENNIKYLIVGWDRTGKKIIRENTVYCKSRAGFQQRIAGIFGRIKFNCFLLKWLITNHKQYNVIHACDLDTVISALFLKLLGKTVIFDIFDWFSDEIRTGKWLIDKIINIFEKTAVKLADMTIICEEERLKQMKVMPNNYLVIRNMPDEEVGKFEEKSNHNKGDLCVAYVGGFVKQRGLQELLEIAAEKNIALQIAGFGDSELTKKIEQCAKENDNIIYYGKVSHKEAMNIMAGADLLYGMYYKSNPNHIYAAPNKFYEGLILEKPIITTAGTLVGNNVLKYRTGFVIEEGKDELEKFFNEINKSDIDNISAGISKIYKHLKKEQEEVLGKYIEYIR